MKQPAAPRMATLIAGRRQLQLASLYAARPAALFKEQNRQACEVILCPANCIAEAPSPIVSERMPDCRRY